MTLPIYPNLSTATDIPMHLTEDITQKQHCVSQAINLTRLCITGWRPFAIVGTYRELDTLCIYGKIHQDSLKRFRAPRLRSILLNLDGGFDVSPLIACDGITTSSLQFAHIEWYRGSIKSLGSARALIYGIRDFLDAVPNLQMLKFGHWQAASLVLKLLTEDCAYLFQSHTLYLVLGGHELELGRADQRLKGVDQFRAETGCIGDWQELLNYVLQSVY